MEPALRNISLSVCKGEKVVILGSNSAGKTTLIKLLLGLYKAPAGTIFYDGVDQSRIDRRTIWQESSALFQDYMKYMLKLRENIAMGSLNELNRDDKLIRALEMAELPLHAFPNGLDTDLGYQTDQSFNLSGGQWQRLGLARSLIRTSSLVVLDEPTAALDPNSELLLLNRIFEHFESATLIMISHRVGTAAKADKIIIMQEGSVAETGTHSELLALGGLYAEMWDNQRAWYLIEESEAV